MLNPPKDKPKDIKTDADLAAHEYIFESFSNTGIPIISEENSRKMKPDYYLVMPWHFKKEILKREKEFLKQGGKLIFPLPKLHVISK